MQGSWYRAYLAYTKIWSGPSAPQETVCRGPNQHLRDRVVVGTHGSEVQGRLQLQREEKTNLGYHNPCLIKTNKTTNNPKLRNIKKIGL